LFSNMKHSSSSWPHGTFFLFMATRNILPLHGHTE
jgi:hypothetical protein